MDLKKVSCEVSCSDNVSYLINREVLKHIVFNLIGNAVDAMSGGGKLNISAEKSDKQLVMIFRDTGEGIPEENIENIFNPFFTTKKRGKGTGLGLYIVYSDIRRYGGDITVESLPGKGTVFSVYLPLENGTEDE
jgi:polar amino acid transport system substrate-binding protein